MSWERDWETMIQKHARTYLRDILSIVPCTVDSVDKDNRVCDCTPIGGDATTQVPGVQLCAENDNGLLVFPSIGSTVIVALSTRNTAFVVMYSAVDSIQFLDGTYGGLTKTLELQTQLDFMKARLEAIITAATTWIVSPGDGGAAFKAAVVAAMTGLPVEDFTQIENVLVKHGGN